MAVQRLVDFLDKSDVHYATINHSRAYTAQTVARSAHIKAREMAKVVIVGIDDRLAMVVLPASDTVDIELLQTSIGNDNIRLATEEEFNERFPDCEPGAMPPFGNLYDMEVFVSPHLTEDELIAFNAGTHTELIQLPYGDFSRLVDPTEIRLSNQD